MTFLRLPLLVMLLAGLATVAAADPIKVRAGAAAYTVDPATLRIDALPDGEGALQIMPPLHGPEVVTVARDGDRWRWTDAEGRTVMVAPYYDALYVTISDPTAGKLAWDLPPASDGTWLIPDGEGMAYPADDPFWRSVYGGGDCLGATTLLSFPAWSYLTASHAVTYALDDGLLSKLCLRDGNGLQASLRHDFSEGAGTIGLLFAVRPSDPLAPALFYRQVLKARGQFTTFADKSVPKLPRLFGAPQAYIWGDGRDLAFLDDLKTLGIDRIVLSYDQDPKTHKHIVTPDYLRKADALGYLAGPYDAFDNGQPKDTADSPASVWSDDLYPSGCVIGIDGQPVVGFANRGCEMSSAAIAGHPWPISPASRYAGHVTDGANQVFIDVDAFGEFYHDYSSDHPMTMAQDRANRLARLGLGMRQYGLVLGSENVTAWSSGVAHYSHGTADAHVGALWPIQSDHKRFGGWWPNDRPPLFFAPFTPTADEARLLFGAADRLPLFEAVFHDSLVASDRWEVDLMKFAGLERQRFARSLLYGTPTMWNLDRKELAREGAWLKAAHDDFHLAHGWDTPAALTGFAWLTPDHLVQQTTYADGRVLTGNFGTEPWHGLAPDCVRLVGPGVAATDLCPPLLPRN